jgi:hypothetical protein
MGALASTLTPGPKDKRPRQGGAFFAQWLTVSGLFIFVFLAMPGPFRRLVIARSQAQAADLGIAFHNCSRADGRRAEPHASATNVRPRR